MPTGASICKTSARSSWMRLSGLEATGQEKPYDLELEMITAKGNNKWVRTIGHPVKDGGKVIKLRGSFQDITDRKQSEKAVRESEIRYRSLFENSLDAVLLTAPDGSILDVNPATCKMFGLTAEEIRKQGRAARVDASDLRLTAALNERSRTGKVRAEITMIRSDGTKFPADISSTIFTDSQGEQRTSMIIRDITERRRAEEAIRESEELFSKIFRASPIALSIARVSDGKLTEVNDVWLKLMGYSREEAVGYNAEELKIVDTELRSKLREELLSKRNLRLVENEITTKSGEKKSILTSAEIITMKGHQFSINLVLDVTERKHAEDLLIQTMNRLIETEETLKRTAAQQLHDQLGQNLTALNLNLSFIRSQIPQYKNEKLEKRLTD
ncbi:MAG: PAS domain S-box protein [bacterium]